MKKGLAATLSILMVAAVLVLTSVKSYYVEDSGGGDLLWNGDEAYLFLGVGSLGYRLNYLQLLEAHVKGYFGTSLPATDKSSSMTVLGLTADAIHRYGPEPLSLSAITPIGQNIYARSDAGLLRWSGTHFEHADGEEQRRFQNRQIASADFTDVDGWSKRCCLTSRDADVKFDIQIGGKPLTLSVKQGSKGNDVSIDLSSLGHTQERIWYLNQRPRKVSKSDYESLFRAADLQK